MRIMGLWSRSLSYLFLILLAITIIFPIYWMVSTAFRSPDEVSVKRPQLVPTKFTLINFRYIFGPRPFRGRRFYPGNLLTAGRNSFLYATTTTVSALLTASMAGYALAKRRFKGDGLVLVIVVIALIAPDPVILASNFLVALKLKLLNTFIGLILPNLTSAFAILLCRQWMLGISDDLIEGARLDGASESRIFLSIIIPITKPLLAVLAVIVFLYRWNELIWPMIVSSTPDKMVLTEIIVRMHRMLRRGWSEIMAGLTLSSLPLLFFYFLSDNRFIDRLVAESVRVVKSQVGKG